MPKKTSAAPGMAHLGTGVQIAARGPQNKFLDMEPEVTYFYKKHVKSSRFASEAVEDLPYQQVQFGKTSVFQIQPLGDLLGPMHVEIRVPAVQLPLGINIPALPPPMHVSLDASVATGSQVTLPGVSIALEGFDSVSGHSRVCDDPLGRVWVFEAAGLEWCVALFGPAGGGFMRVESTLRALSPTAADASRALTVTTSTEARQFVQHAGMSAAVCVDGEGRVAIANDRWKAPLAYALLRRARFVIDDLVVSDHERLWYDVHDRLVSLDGQKSGQEEMLGYNLDMSMPHILLLPLKFLGMTSPLRDARRQTYFPLVLVPRCRVQVELDIESFDFCAPPTATSPMSVPESLAVKLVAERITLDAEERNVMLLQKPWTLMYESVQDMDSVNYADSGTSAPHFFREVSVDLSELNLPVKMLAWVCYAENVQAMFQYAPAVESASLMFGSLERATAVGEAYSRAHVWSRGYRCDASSNIYMYSFALGACRSAPSGAADFSVIQKPVLRLLLNEASVGTQLKCKVFAVTYNWLQISNGAVTRLFSV